MYPSYHLHPLHFFVNYMFNSLITYGNSMNQELFVKHLCNQGKSLWIISIM